VSGIGAVFAVVPYPWSDIIVLLTALAAGILLGRALPPRFRPFLILLLLLSALDIAQTILTGGLTHLPSSPPAHTSAPMSGAMLFLNLSLPLPVGHYLIGIFDLLVITAAAEYWRRRGASYFIAFLPGILGFLLAYGAVLTTQYGGGPLIPFITTGWLGSELIARTSKSGKSR
jgi:hypothetical protein